jgi:hypothetical protein
LLRSLGAEVNPKQLADFVGNDAKKDRNRLSTALVLSWLLADQWFASAKLSSQSLLALLTSSSAELAAQTASRSFTTDPDRREELVRTALARLDFRPKGETTAQAQDRLSSLSVIERQRLIAASRAAEERARSIREALARKAAEESADKYTRE